MTNGDGAPPGANLPIPRSEMSLFGGQKGAEAAIAEARDVAGVLKEALLASAEELISKIEVKERGEPTIKEHVNFEGWTLLGALVGAVTGVGVYADIEWTHRIPGGDGRASGWEARAAARTTAGGYLGAVEMQCARDESRWQYRDDFQVRSMAETRAQAKALRQALGWIMALTGYSVTPAEEMEALMAERERGPAAERVAGPARRKSNGLGIPPIPDAFPNPGALMNWAKNVEKATGYTLDSATVARIAGVNRVSDLKTSEARGHAAEMIAAAVEKALGPPDAPDAEPFPELSEDEARDAQTRLVGDGDEQETQAEQSGEDGERVETAEQKAEQKAEDDKPDGAQSFEDELRE